MVCFCTTQTFDRFDQRSLIKYTLLGPPNMSHNTLHTSAVPTGVYYSSSRRSSTHNHVHCIPSATVDTHWRHVQRCPPPAAARIQDTDGQPPTLHRRALFTLAALLSTPLAAVAAPLAPAAINPALAPDQRLYDAADPALRDAAALLQRALNANTVQVCHISTRPKACAALQFTGGGGPLYAAYRPLS